VEGIRYNLEEVESEYGIVGVRIIASKTLWAKSNNARMLEIIIWWGRFIFLFGEGKMKE